MDYTDEIPEGGRGRGAQREGTGIGKERSRGARVDRGRRIGERDVDVRAKGDEMRYRREGNGRQMVIVIPRMSGDE